MFLEPLGMTLSLEVEILVPLNSRQEVFVCPPLAVSLMCCSQRDR